MDLASFSARDWLVFVGPYVVWCAMMLAVWGVVRRRTGVGLAEAILFSLVFAPSLCPIVREAFVIAPVGVSALYISFLYLLQRSEVGTLRAYANVLLLTCAAPFFLVLASSSLVRAKSRAPAR